MSLQMQSILLRRKNKISLDGLNEQVGDNADIIFACCKNLQELGYSMSIQLMDKLRFIKRDEVLNLLTLIQQYVEDTTGVRIAEATVMYPNFPQEVMEASDIELFINACVHYLTKGTLLPDIKKNKRLPLIGVKNFNIIELGTDEDMKQILINLMSANTSLSEQDKEDLIGLYHDFPLEDYPEMKFKENMVTVVTELIKEPLVTTEMISPFLKTATDVLRLYTGMCDGDVSLGTNSKFKSIPRKTRRMLLACLDSVPNIEEGMLRHKNKWLRVGEFLHPFEYPQYKRVYSTFRKLRNKEKIETFGGKVQELFNKKEYIKAAEKLSRRPAELARRLDELLRKGDETQCAAVLQIFESVADKVSSRVLLQVLEHFCNRGTFDDPEVRVVFPKGRIDKMAVLPNLDKMPLPYITKVTVICQNALKKIYSSKAELGKVYIDENLSNHLIPTTQRTASKTTKTLTRGSRVPFKERYMRGFCWWTNTVYDDVVDLDLSAVILDNDLTYRSCVSYYNLKDKKCSVYHSGDIINGGSVDGKGVAEFIDIDTEAVVKAGGRYVAFQVNSYSGQTFDTLINSSFGWMERQDINSGEIFEPSTVEMKMDLTSNHRMTIPVLFDCVDKVVIWLDASIGIHAPGGNVHNTFSKSSATLYAMVNMNKLDMYYLAYLHGMARGQIVADREDADIIFSNDTSPVFIEKIKTRTDQYGNEFEDTVLEEKNVKYVTAYDLDVWQEMI